MSGAFITLWSPPQIELQRRQRDRGETPGHTANDRFRRVGVVPADRIYVVVADQGQLRLIMRVLVERVEDLEEVLRRLVHAVYEAVHNVLAHNALATGTPPGRVVPEEIVRELERDSGQPITIAGDEDRVDAGSLRMIGRITEDSAALLDAPQ